MAIKHMLYACYKSTARVRRGHGMWEIPPTSRRNFRFRLREMARGMMCGMRAFER